MCRLTLQAKGAEKRDYFRVTCFLDGVEQGNSIEVVGERFNKLASVGLSNPFKIQDEKNKWKKPKRERRVVGILHLRG